MKSKLFLTEEDIRALEVVPFNVETVKDIRQTLEKHHSHIFRLQTNEFLAEQFHKLRQTTDTDERMKLMWEIVTWKERYKSPYLENK